MRYQLIPPKRTVVIRRCVIGSPTANGNPNLPIFKVNSASNAAGTGLCHSIWKVPNLQPRDVVLCVVVSSDDSSETQVRAQHSDSQPREDTDSRYV
jgi:hypothetical protein